MHVERACVLRACCLMRLHVAILQDSIVLDLHAGKNFRHWTRGYSPCLTAARCKSRGYYVTRAQRRFTVTDMLILQGMQVGRVDWQALNVAEGSFGHMIGNSMSVNVLERLLPRVLMSAGLVPRDSVPDWWEMHHQDAAEIVRKLRGGGEQ